MRLDNQRNVSGESGTGLVGLNVFSDLYVGGYGDYQMSGLPDELPFTNSFKGNVLIISQKQYTGACHLRPPFLFGRW